MGRLLLLLALVLWPALVAAQALPGVRVLATGGTIAGAGRADSAGYRPGQLGVADLIAAVPGVAGIATLSAEQIANIGSADIDEAVWRRLHGRILAAIADPGVAGVVITHGTDTLEETAFFLHLLLPATKPVVLVGSMRPATAVSADGPHNLMDAIRVAAAPAAAARGVMVMMNDQLFDPRFVTKMDMRQLNAFAAPATGPIGHVQQVQPVFFTAPPVATAPAFALADAPLPRVAIAYAHTGMTGDDLRRIAQGADGLVIAGPGAGSMPSSVRNAARALVADGMTVVRTARQGTGDIWRNDSASGAENDATTGVIAGRWLPPAKARILLLLALQQRRSPAEIQALFDRLGTPGG
ncbi:MAG: asparaginase [Alphaproteobacteria bacterium]|nr:asparaginase [Alphaproteobacteria bacterium]